MKCNRVFFLLLIFISTNCFSQLTGKPDITDVTKVTFFNPGVSYEKQIGKLQSLYAQAFLNTSFAFGFSDALGTTFKVAIDPGFILQYRYYYNTANRETKGKRTKMNSLNYVSPVLQTVFSDINISDRYLPEEKKRAINIAGVTWGFQRNYIKRFSLDLNLGIGYLFTTGTIINDAGQHYSDNVRKLTTISQLNLGFWLNKRK